MLLLYNEININDGRNPLSQEMIVASNLDFVKANSTRYSFIAVLVLFSFFIPNARAGETLLLLDTDNPMQWKSVKNSITRFDGRVLAVCPPELMIVDVDPAVIKTISFENTPITVYDGPIALRKTFKPGSRTAIALWNERHQKDSPIKQESARDIASMIEESGDVFLPPDIPPALLKIYEGIGFPTAEDEKRARSARSLRLSHLVNPKYYTSAFMSGEVVVGAILPESNGAIDAEVEDWTETEVTLVHEKIMRAMTNFQQECPTANLTFIYHWDDAPGAGGVPGTIDCDYEAVNNPSLATRNALGRLTYENSPGTRDYANHLRNLYEADWAFFFSVADDSITLSGRAYAFLGGPYSQCYGHNPSSVYQHETGHIFNAMDEYHPDAARSPISRAGYQQVVNANSEYNNGLGYNGGAGEGVSALMLDTSNRHSAYSVGQLGWYDSDGDGILDVSDSFPDVMVNHVEESNGVVTFAGQATVSHVRSQQSGFSVGFSVNELTDVEWRLAGQCWQPATAVDGSIDEGTEDISFSVGPLPDGEYCVETRATHNLGNTTILPRKTLFSVSSSTVTNAAPFAGFVTDTALQRRGYDIVFDAEVSSDLETPGSSLQIRWDWETDGIWDTPYSFIKTASHAYSTAGQYQITLEVKDSDGQTGSISKTVLVSEDNVSPIAKFTVVTGNIHGEFNPTYFFNASDTFDPEGDTVEVRWDWDNNNSWDTGFSSNLQANHTYSLPTNEGGKSAQWTVAMQARDSNGGVTKITREIWSCPYNDAPVADLSVNPLIASTDTQIIFDASNSTDANIDTTWDGLLEYRFDWNGDGNWDTDMITNPTHLHNYSEPGTYYPRVQVRDRFSALDEVSYEIVVGTDPVEQPFWITGAKIEPSWMQIASNGNLQLNAILEYVGTPGDLSVTWFVEDIQGGDPSVGTITTNGFYSAPEALGYYHVKAVSNHNPNVIASATMNVATNFVYIYPSGAILTEGQTQQFLVTTGFTYIPTVTWYVNDIPGGHPLLGFIDSNGLYTAPAEIHGEFEVYLKAVSDENPNYSAMVPISLRSANPPTVDFSASVTAGDAPLEVEFTSVTTNGVTAWDWDFDDGTQDSGESVTHVFLEPGLYTIRLTVDAPGGTAEETKVAYIQVNGGTAPLVDFFALENPVSHWDVATLNPIIIGEVDTYEWNFAGLAGDIQTNGMWNQPPEGLHTVSLTVTGPGGSATKTKTDYLKVWEDFFSVDFAVHGQQSGRAPLEVEFVALTMADVLSYDWDFGDPVDTSGFGTNGPNPVHTYTQPGLYTVTLTVEYNAQTGGDGSSRRPGDPNAGGHQQIATETKVDLIEILPPLGDCSADGTIDINDLPCFIDCLTGPATVRMEECEVTDMNENGTIDLHDFSILQCRFGL